MQEKFEKWQVPDEIKDKDFYLATFLDQEKLGLTITLKSAELDENYVVELTFGFVEAYRNVDEGAFLKDDIPGLHVKGTFVQSETSGFLHWFKEQSLNTREGLTNYIIKTEDDTLEILAFDPPEIKISNTKEK